MRAMTRWRLRGLLAASFVAASCGVIGGNDTASDTVWALGDEPTAAAVGYLMYEPSPDGEWVAFRSQGSICLASLASVGESGVAADSDGTQCFDTEADNLAWSPDSSQVAANSDAVRFFEPGPVELLGTDGNQQTVFDDELLVFDTAWLDTDTLVYAEIIRSDDSLASTVWHRISVGGGERPVFFEPDSSGPAFPASYWSLSATGDLAVVLIADDGSTGLFIRGAEEPTIQAVPPSQLGPARFDARSTANGFVVLRDVASVDRRPLEVGTGWWVTSRELDEPLELQAPDPSQTRIVDAVLSPNGTTLAVMTEPWERRGQGQYSLTLVRSAEVVDAGGVLDLTTASAIALADGLGVGLTNPAGQLRWTLDDQLLVIGNGELLGYTLTPS